MNINCTTLVFELDLRLLLFRICTLSIGLNQITVDDQLTETARSKFFIVYIHI